MDYSRIVFMSFSKISFFGPIAVVVLGLVTGCQSTGSDYGEGKITLSPSVEQSLAQYMSLIQPSYFAVSTNGKSSGWTFCPSHKRCDKSTPYNAIQYCETGSYGVPCKVYASGKVIVWNNPDGPEKAVLRNRPAKRSTTIADLSVGTLCGIATKVEGKWAVWDNSLSDHVTEAKRRGLSLQKCAGLTGKEVQGNSRTAKDRLQELKGLLEDGTITQSDYENKKKEILSSI
jgi:hypothetical protein